MLVITSPSTSQIPNLRDIRTGITEAARYYSELRRLGVPLQIVDVGGESTRPGAQAVPLQQELDRVIPVIEAIAPELSIPVSIDTSKPEVMAEAVAAGAGMLNDVYALRRDGALEAAAKLGVPVCVMHMQGEPRVMQDNPTYGDVGAELSGRLQQAERDRFGNHDHQQRPGGLACRGQVGIVVDPAEEIRVLNDDTGGLGVNRGRGVFAAPPVDDEFDPQPGNAASAGFVIHSPVAYEAR